jgi:hypothetical protein
LTDIVLDKAFQNGYFFKPDSNVKAALFFRCSPPRFSKSQRQVLDK